MRLPSSPPSAGLGEQRIELARLLQGVMVVGDADMLAVDEDLRNGGTPGALAHFGALLVVHHDVHFLVGRALAVEQALGPCAETAERRGVNLDLGHEDPLWPDYIVGRTTRASVRTSTWRGAPPLWARAHAPPLAPPACAARLHTT